MPDDTSQKPQGFKIRIPAVGTNAPVTASPTAQPASQNQPTATASSHPPKRLTRREINRNLRIHNQAEIIRKVTTVAPETVDQRIDEGRKLQALITVNEPEFTPIIQQHCNKTGRPLHKLAVAEIHKTVAAHGRKRAIELLQISRLSVVAPEWLATDPQALTALCKVDPIGYFLYSAGLIWSPQSFKRANGIEPHSIFDGPVMKYQPDEFVQAVTGSTQLQLLCLNDRILAWENLQQVSNLETIVELNEILRRIFAIASPFSMLRIASSRSGSLATITANSSTLAEFRQTLGVILANLTKAIANTHVALTDPLYISHADICDVTRKCKGMASFRQQEHLSSRSSVDRDIMLGLRDFVVDELTKSRKKPRIDLADLTIQEFSGACIAKTAEQAKGLALKINNQQTAKPSLADLLRRK